MGMPKLLAEQASERAASQSFRHCRRGVLISAAIAAANPGAAHASNDAILSKLQERKQVDAAAEIDAPVSMRIERLRVCCGLIHMPSLAYSRLAVNS